jgi:L-tartrate/succinate antiporter
MSRQEINMGLLAVLALALWIFGDKAQTALLLCLSLGIMGIITPCGTGPSPIWYGTGYVKPGTLWLLGAVFGFIFQAVFLLVCVPWIGYLGA